MEGAVDILNFDRSGLVHELQGSLGLPSFRAKQLIPWLYRERVRTFEPMTDISLAVRSKLSERFLIGRPTPTTIQQSKDGTRKYLFALPSGGEVESVLIHQPKRWTLCVSSQVGCAMGCKFCRTAQMGLKRNLTTAEIVGQVLAVKDDVSEILARGEGEPGMEFQNIVFMGMGEPFHNIDNVIRAVQVLNDELGLAFSGRKITVSTSGLVPAIEKFGASDARANLAVSLNATTDEIRTAIMPVNKRYPLAVLLDALRRYPLKPGRRITLEYVMLGGLNDTDADLDRLPELVRGIPAKVNLIPYNENAGLDFKSPSRERVFIWQESLLSRGLNATIRWSKGDDISAACGQLATAKQN